MTSLKTLFVLGTALVVTGTMAGTPAQAFTDKNFTYTKPKKGFLAVSPMAFSPDGDASAVDYFNSWGGALTGSGCYNTGISLPNRATITSITYVHLGEVYVNLVSTGIGTGLTTNIVSETSPLAAARTVRKVNVSPEYIVANGTSMIGLGVCLNANEEFFGAKITYTYTSAGD